MTSYRARYFDEKGAGITRLIYRDIAAEGSVLPRSGPRVVENQCTLLFNSDMELDDIRRVLKKLDPNAECEYFNGVTMRSYLSGQFRF